MNATDRTDRLAQLAAELRTATANAERARKLIGTEVVRLHLIGVKATAIATVLGVTRERVYQIRDGALDRSRRR